MSIRDVGIRLEHVVYPSGWGGIREVVRRRMNEVVQEGGTVCYVDFMADFVYAQWPPYVTDRNKFLMVQPESLPDAARILYEMCGAGVDLVVLSAPRLYPWFLEGEPRNSDALWGLCLEAIQRFDKKVTVLAVNPIQTKESTLAAYDGFPVWTELADTERLAKPETGPHSW